MNLLCNGQECHSQAQCLDSKCVCNSGYQGDGVTCNGKYLLIRILDNKCVPLSHTVTQVCNVPPLTFSFNFEPFLLLTTVFLVIAYLPLRRIFKAWKGIIYLSNELWRNWIRAVGMETTPNFGRSIRELKQPSRRRRRGQRQCQKAISFMWKTTALHVHHAFKYISLQKFQNF